MHCDGFVNFLTDFMLLSRHETMNQKGPSVSKFYFPFWKFMYLSNNLLKNKKTALYSVFQFGIFHMNIVMQY